MIWGIIAVVAFIIIMVIRGMYKSGRQMSKLQDIASLFSGEFKEYVRNSRGWSVSDDPKSTSGWYKLHSGDGSTYYIRFEGPMPFQTAVDLLMEGFVHRLNKQG